MNISGKLKECVGCGVCIASCPTNAIHMDKDCNGFYIPKINDAQCVSCSKCVGICTTINIVRKGRKSDYYYGWINDDEIRMQSSSGGIFSALANYILSIGGVVYGCSYAEDNKTIIMNSTNECSLDNLRRSKYCQAYHNEIYNKIQSDLKADKSVLMVGTPCQIAAARNLFGNNSNLYLVDFLCGGVTTPNAYENYLNWMETKYKSKIKSINFRDKSNGWKLGWEQIKIEFINGKVYTSHFEFDPYFFYYFTPYLKREHCTHCAFVNHEDADIVIADFWGYKAANIQSDGKGISLITVSTKQGENLINGIKSIATLNELDEKDVKYAYHKKNVTEQALEQRKKFLTQMQHSSFIDVAKEYRFKYGKAGIYAHKILRRLHLCK